MHLSIGVFSAVIIVSLPDYLSPDILDLDSLVPSCGDQFQGTVKQVAEFAIGLFFSCLFTSQLSPILVSNSIIFQYDGGTDAQRVGKMPS